MTPSTTAVPSPNTTTFGSCASTLEPPAGSAASSSVAPAQPRYFLLLEDSMTVPPHSRKCVVPATTAVLPMCPDVTRRNGASRLRDQVGTGPDELHTHVGG